MPEHTIYAGDYHSYKVTIHSSWYNSTPIVRYTLANNSDEAIKQVCSWFQIAHNLPSTVVSTEINHG